MPSNAPSVGFRDSRAGRQRLDHRCARILKTILARSEVRRANCGRENSATTRRAERMLALCNRVQRGPKHAVVGMIDRPLRVETDPDFPWSVSIGLNSSLPLNLRVVGSIPTRLTSFASLTRAALRLPTLAARQRSLRPALRVVASPLPPSRAGGRRRCFEHVKRRHYRVMLRRALEDICKSLASCAIQYRCWLR